MKQFIVGVVIIAVLGFGGFVGFRYLSHQNQTSVAPKSQSDTLTGLLMPGKGDDYSFILLDTKGKTTGVTSQTIDLKTYANKNVEVTGQFSGTTLYADTVTEKK